LRRVNEMSSPERVNEMQPPDTGEGLMTHVFKVRWLTAVAVMFSAIGAALLFVIGAVTTITSVGVYLGLGGLQAFSSEAALGASVNLIAALDQFLLGLVLLVFAYGVYGLFVVADRDLWETARIAVKAPDWLKVTSVTDLKLKLLEVITVLLAVLFLKFVLTISGDKAVTWPDLVVPIAVVLFGATTWLIKSAHRH
jgi:uncharacterized membrane protein YqhA